MKKVFLILMLALCALVYAQSPQLKISHITYGDFPSDVFVTISNPSEVPVSRVNIYVDDQLFKSVEEGLSEKTAIKVHLIIPAGEHTLKISSPEGAEDEIKINIGELITTTTVQVEEEAEWQISKRDILGVIFIIIIFIVGLIVERSAKKRS